MAIACYLPSPSTERSVGDSLGEEQGGTGSRRACVNVCCSHGLVVCGLTCLCSLVQKKYFALLGGGWQSTDLLRCSGPLGAFCGAVKGEEEEGSMLSLTKGFADIQNLDAVQSCI